VSLSGVFRVACRRLIMRFRFIAVGSGSTGPDTVESLAMFVIGSGRLELALRS
jgi:hypothetical protein